MDDIYRYYVTEDINDELLIQYWDEVCFHVEEVSFVQQREWIASYINSEIDNRDYYCFVVFLRDEKPAAVFPMQYCNTSRFGFSLETLCILSPRELSLNDFVISSVDNNKDILKYLTKFLKDKCDLSWDLLELRHCREGGSVDRVIANNPPNRLISILDLSSDYLICKSESENSVIQHSSKFKRNLRRLWKKLREKGEVTTHLYNEGGDLEKAFEDFLIVESSGWKGDGRTSLLHDKKLQSFYKALLRNFSAKKACFIHTMKVDGQPVASQFAVITGDTYNMFKIGYDEDYKSIGPGALLLDETVRLFSNDDSINAISFVTGGNWQNKWLPKSLYIKNHYIYNGTLKGNICFTLEKTKDYLRKIKHYFNK